MNNDALFWSVKETAKYLGMSKNKIYQMVEVMESPTLPFFRVGRTIRFAKKDVEAYVRRITVQAK